MKEHWLLWPSLAFLFVMHVLMMRAARTSAIEDNEAKYQQGADDQYVLHSGNFLGAWYNGHPLSSTTTTILAAYAGFYVPVRKFGVTKMKQTSYGAEDCLAPSPIFPPLGESGWIEVEIPEPKYQNIVSQAQEIKLKGRVYQVHWDSEAGKLWMKEDKTKRAWYRKIQDWIKEKL